MPEGYPEIEALEKTLKDHDLLLRVEPEPEDSQSSERRRVRLTRGQGDLDLSILVDDESGDATDEHQLLLLHLVLAECEGYEEASDILVWAAESELDASESWVRGLFSELGEVVPRIREVVGTDVKALASWDFTMNTGPARDLRKRR
jgi:hypothetical protein